jgi:hypothetical protein
VSDNKEGPSPEEKTTGLVSTLGSYVLHASVAMVIGPIVAFVLCLSALFIFDNSRAINSVLDVGGPANPLLWGPGLILGLLVNRFALKSTACWVWLAGMVWIACGVSASLYTYHARFAGICSPLDSIRNGFFSYVRAIAATARMACFSLCRPSAQLPIRSEPTHHCDSVTAGTPSCLENGGSQE